MYSTRLEGIAGDLLATSLCEDTPPVDAFELAACCQLEVRLSDVKDALLYGDTIYLSRRASIHQVHKLVAHEIGHWAQRRDGAEDTEEGADYLAGALLVPRAPLLRALRGGWDLNALRAQHRNAPASLIAQRVAQLREATAAIYDGRKLHRRVGPPHPAEHLVSEVLATDQPVRIDDCTGVWPVIAGSRRRVIVLGAAA